MPAARVKRRMGGGARVAAVLIAFLASACMETRRSLGEDCLKNDDCLSGVCAQFLCASAPPTIDTPPVADAEPDEGAVAPEGAPDGPEGTATDSSTDSDADETDLGD